jgi:hypothetical protein
VVTCTDDDAVVGLVERCGHRSFSGNSGRAFRHSVVAGLDPAIHHFARSIVHD